MAQEIRNMENLIDYLIPLLGRQFPDDVSFIYFGDVGMFPPQAFLSTNKEQRLVICVIPDYDRPVPGSRSAAAETRDLGVLIAVLVNMTPYFQRMPSEAFGERNLVRLTNKIKVFLQQDANFDLQRQVQTSKVNNIDWDWMQRGNNSIRAAAIEYQVQIEVDRTEL